MGKTGTAELPPGEPVSTTQINQQATNIACIDVKRDINRIDPRVLVKLIIPSYIVLAFGISTSPRFIASTRDANNMQPPRLHGKALMAGITSACGMGFLLFGCTMFHTKGHGSTLIIGAR